MYKLLSALLFCLALATPAFAGQAVDINSADEATLSTLDGVGPAKAKAIIEYRNKNGKFKSIEEFEKVPGIGPATLKQNAARLTVK